MTTTSPPAKEHSTDEPVNESGPPGTYGCNCTARDSYQCAAEKGPGGQLRCSCLCHGWKTEDARKLT